MRGTVNPGSLQFDPEIERTVRRNRRLARERRQQRNMAENGNPPPPPPVQTLGEHFGQRPNHGVSCIVVPPVEANNFVINPSLIQLVKQNQYGGDEHEDPNEHITSFVELCSTTKQNGVPSEVILLTLFPFSLRDIAADWLRRLPARSIFTWDDMMAKFLNKFFPTTKTMHLMAEITTFQQRDTEPLHKAWERFKNYLRRCPHHGLTDYQQVWYFLNGLTIASHGHVIAAANGSIENKTPEQALALKKIWLAMSISILQEEPSQEES